MMKKNKTTLRHYRDPSAKLKKALSILDTFAENNTLPSSFFCHHYTGSVFKKMLSLTGYFLASAFSEKVRKQSTMRQDQIQSDLLNAIDDVKRYQPMISTQKTAEEQALAKRAIETISRFNQIVESHTSSFSWHQRLLRFLFKRNRISLANTEKIEISTTTKITQETFPKFHPLPQKVDAFIEQSDLSHTVTNREVDAFRMKAISLIQKHRELVGSSIVDAFNFVQKSPIYTSISRDAKKEGFSASSVISLQQTITPFPGETIILQGAFKRNPEALSPITPIAESFALSSKSVQTGFPYPSQYSGWALTDHLIPANPHRLDQLSQVPALLKKKKDIAEKFLRKDPLLAKAQKLLTSKQKAVEQNREAFFSLHKKLCSAIISAAPQDVLDVSNPVPSFFRWLEAQPSSLNTISTVYHAINHLFIIEPYNALYQAWTEQTNRDLLSDNPIRSYSAALQILQEMGNQAKKQLENMQTLPSEVAAFQRYMGKILGTSSQRIILQQASELMEFAPPELTLFEKKLLSAAFRQLNGLFQELEHEQTSFAKVEQYLQKDYHLFCSRTLQDPIVFEIEFYYKSRFYTQLSQYTG